MPQTETPLTRMAAASDEALQGDQMADLHDEARRLMTICNACRYCEGYCGVFPAMMRQNTFADGDLDYLANLCHGCNGCYYACQYAPPHEFAVNVPQAFARLRADTYRRYTWPGALAGLFQKNGTLVSVLMAGGIGLVLALIHLFQPAEVIHGEHAGNFYAVIPHNVMAYSFGGVFLYAVGVLLFGFWRFRRDTAPKAAETALSVAGATHDALVMKYMGGGGVGGKNDGCNYPSESFSQVRRVFHQLTFWGFLLCFAATSLATVYHYVFGWQAPYGYTSLPVLLGTVGGIGLLIGPLGLIYLKSIADPNVLVNAQRGMDTGFLALLFLVSLTGLALLAWRETGYMGTLLAIHLGTVLALFLTMPYGKFVHAVYRYAALLRNRREQKR
ncbi:MAG: tricarballylate utilization 4Fe-4S protein TcuB [Rhodospirillales bacterium]